MPAAARVTDGAARRGLPYWHLGAMGALLALAAATGCATLHARSSPRPGPATVHISAFKFVPEEITVSSRDSIVWVNDDALEHTSTADNGAWASPELSKGARYTLIAPAPGRYTYHCAAHPEMTGVLHVRLEE
ncbi:MAG TPA: cupredoxin domain-containing protein [Gemmatimonadaceae bacterium]